VAPARAIPAHREKIGPVTTRTMRAFVLNAPGEGAVEEVPAPQAAPGEVVVDVERVGVCGTDVEFFTGESARNARGIMAEDGSMPEDAGSQAAEQGGPSRRCRSCEYPGMSCERRLARNHLDAASRSNPQLPDALGKESGAVG
jgi:hypothetical protein